MQTDKNNDNIRNNNNNMNYTEREASRRLRLQLMLKFHMQSMRWQIYDFQWEFSLPRLRALDLGHISVNLLHALLPNNKLSYCPSRPQMQFVCPEKSSESCILQLQLGECAVEYLFHAFAKDQMHRQVLNDPKSHLNSLYELNSKIVSASLSSVVSAESEYWKERNP